MSSVRPTILLVEPSESIRTTISSFLEAHGFRVECAQTDAEAITMLNGYAAIVVNVVLARGLGLSLLEHIARDRPAFTPRVVVITSDDIQSVNESLQRVGICEIVPKPVRAEEILAAVRECLQTSPAEVH